MVLAHHCVPGEHEPCVSLDIEEHERAPKQNDHAASSVLGNSNF